MLTRAIYVSDAVGMAGATALSLAEILGAAGRNNRRDALTGALLFYDGGFLQMIEGARPDVDRLLSRLMEDRRHQNLRLLAHGPASARRFAGAPMAQGRVTADVLRRLGARGMEGLTAESAEQVLLAAAVLDDASV